MTTFDLAEVRQFAAEIETRLDRCDLGEGFDCANLDETLRRYAESCCEFNERVRAWGRAIFYGQAAFDPEVEQVWLAEGHDLLRRGIEQWDHGQEQEGKCFVLESGAALGAALWQLERLLRNWVSPKRAIAPLARHGVVLSPADLEAALERVANLPPLPADWEPVDPRQRTMIRKSGRGK